MVPVNGNAVGKTLTVVNNVEFVFMVIFGMLATVVNGMLSIIVGDIMVVVMLVVVVVAGINSGVVAAILSAISMRFVSLSMVLASVVITVAAIHELFMKIMIICRTM